jgi:voltage-gated potassium channel
VAVLGIGTVGYVLLGFGWLDAVYQAVTTVATVGFREVVPFGTAEKIFTILLVLGGVGTTLYALGVVLESLLEGRLTGSFGRRRMDRKIAGLTGHVVVCGWGRVGRAVAATVTGHGGDVVVVDRNPERVESQPFSYVVGDVTDDAVLLGAGVERARVLVAALDTDADNLFLTLSARALNRSLFIVARARVASTEAKLTQAGADRVVNPQSIGGARMAAFALQPNVAEFLDVVMHDGSLEFRLEEVCVPEGSSVAGSSLRSAHLRDQTGALVLALKEPDGTFTTNPAPDTLLVPGQFLIAIGTSVQLEALAAAVAR